MYVFVIGILSKYSYFSEFLGVNDIVCYDISVCCVCQGSEHGV